MADHDDDGTDDGTDDTLADAARELYAVAPEQFLATRTELVERARSAGAADAARAIGKLRKPTVSAWLVNALALADDTVQERVSDLGDRLRAAQQQLDARVLRELTRERRSLVADLAKRALAQAGRGGASTATQDEVRGTFDAAVADPDVAARLGVLQRAESFSGFGFGDAGGAPRLTVVRGGRAEPPATAGTAKKAPSKAATKAGRTAGRAAGKATAPKSPPKRDPAAEARQRAVEQAREQVQQAEEQVRAARAGEKDAADRVGAAERALAQARADVIEAKKARDTARDAHRAALAGRREARRALDRAGKGR